MNHTVPHCPCCERTRVIVDEHLAKLRQAFKLYEAYDHPTAQDDIAKQISVLVQLKTDLDAGEPQ